MTKVTELPDFMLGKTVTDLEQSGIEKDLEGVLSRDMNIPAEAKMPCLINGDSKDG